MATVDASGAGEGQLAADVTLDGRNIPVKVTAVQPERYQASFVPDSVGVHQLRVYFAGVEISGEFYAHFWPLSHVVQSCECQKFGLKFEKLKDAITVERNSI